ncbi:hypothetical protein [Halostagnicola bangensis]
MTGEKVRTMGVCADCGSAYAAREQADGSVLPIGVRNGCTCGGTTFLEVESGIGLEAEE